MVTRTERVVGVATSVLLCALCSAATEPRGPEDVARAFLAAAEGEDWPAAMDLLGPTGKAQLEQFYERYATSGARLAQSAAGYWEADPDLDPRSWSKAPERTAPWLLQLLELRPLVPRGDEVEYDITGVIQKDDRAYVVIESSVKRSERTLREYRVLELVRAEGMWYVSIEPAEARATTILELYESLDE